MKGKKTQNIAAESYREPMIVTEIRQFRNGDVFPVCPRCQITLEREYQSYCDRCGQRLNWKKFCHAHVVSFDHELPV